MEDPLTILGLKPGDTLKTAHKNRNALFLKLHPDKNPIDKEAYHKVYAAYEALQKNPNLLTTVRVSTSKVEQIIRVKTIVSIEDFYFKKKQTLTINRKVFCRRCHGVGSASGTSNKCPHCNGTGKIDSSVFALLGKDSTCPICKGKGINAADTCPSCGGIRYEQETKVLQFTLDPIHFHKKAIVLPNVGDQFDHQSYGSVVVVLSVLNDSLVNIEENYFVVYDKILPIQKIIGDTKTVKVFGRDVEYKISENSTEAYTRDRISQKNSPEIRVKFLNILPKHTRETIALYKQILEIEKRNITDGCSIQL